MVVTELAYNSHLTSPSNDGVFASLRAGIEAQGAYSNAHTYLLTQIEDPSYIYIIGKWDSVSQHMDEWVPGETNQGILQRLADAIEVCWVQHLDLDPSEPKEESLMEVFPYSADVVAIGRYFVSLDDKEGFERTFNETKGYVKEFKGPRKIAGAWRKDREVDEKGNAQEEFVMLSGWNAVEEHMAFAESDGFKEWARIKGFLKGAEIKHARWTFKI